MEIKPIRSDEDHDAALREIEELWGTEPGTPEGDRLDVLITLAEAWERAHHPIDPPDPVEAIKFRLEQRGLDQKALINVIGNRSRVYEVMNHQRGLTLAMIWRLNQHLSIPADVLIRPMALKKASNRIDNRTPAPKKPATRKTIAR
ncbi:MAG TPA: transcriptional regulator [Pantanalinema sp.]